MVVTNIRCAQLIIFRWSSSSTRSWEASSIFILQGSYTGEHHNNHIMTTSSIHQSQRPEAFKHGNQWRLRPEDPGLWSGATHRCGDDRVICTHNIKLSNYHWRVVIMGEQSNYHDITGASARWWHGRQTPESSQLISYFWAAQIDSISNFFWEEHVLQVCCDQMV